jgi:hypothetical protein
MSTIEACGHYTIDNTNNSDALSCEPGLGYFTFQQRNGATFNLIKLDGNIFSSTSKMSAYARIPIQGWANSAVSIVPLDGMVRSLGYAEVAGPVAITGTIPADNTIPQNTEGDQILTVTVNPTRVGGRLVAEVTVYGSEETNTGSAFITALFKNSQANAVQADAIVVDDVSQSLTQGRIFIRYRETITDTSPITFNVRCGLNSGSGVINEPSANGTDFTLGSTIVSSIRVYEEN